MLFTTILASTIALGMGVSAAPTPVGNTRLVQLRLFGESGCSALNQGELGVYGDRINQCQTFPGPTTIKSVSFEYKYQANCTVAVYNDVTCSVNRQQVEVKTCLSGDEQYGSYIVECPSLA
ncbi:hypothetical protein ANOM_010029 [Aspergillus nomiae NRRL 13137]|uniref:Uncharacterized protein n=1 Tax=Aspergillus nomiae NRRL (strain ATCC 15546 / NRRL 13137 / CBS 260.88 / M93) TaxID=1509407 RepID=A0A0L1IQ47_ASPN3|nr:uncharacterized protein ANOM_010029 [Aspergillus nomiae NRRL 13137]KNG81460.1 hypothetical protein ANOM_010029 [Aspergillus nomiae NRRL 13137]